MILAVPGNGDGCSDFDERNFDGFCDGDPNTPGSEVFNGFWEVEGTLEPGQIHVGTTRTHVEVRGGRAACVSKAISDYCPNLDYGEPSAAGNHYARSSVLDRLYCDGRMLCACSASVGQDAALHDRRNIADRRDVMQLREIASIHHNPCCLAACSTAGAGMS